MLPPSSFVCPPEHPTRIGPGKILLVGGPILLFLGFLVGLSLFAGYQWGKASALSRR